MIDSIAWARSNLYAHPLIAFVIVLAAARTLRSVYGGSGQRAEAVLAGTGILALAAAMLHYLLLPGHSDHVEASTVAVTAAWMNGQAMYPPLDSAYQYGLPYGPWLYLLNAASLGALGPGITQSKLLSVGAAAASVWLMARGQGGRRLANAGTAAWALLAFGTMAYWVRPEPLLLLFVAIAARAGRPRPVLLGVTLGVGVSLKLTAALYFAPLLVPLFLRAPPRAVASMLAAAGAVALLPFLLPLEISIDSYRAILGLTAAHGFRWRSLLTQIEWAAFFSIPVFVAWRRTNRSDTRVFCWAVAGCLILTVPFAAKHGAGPHHFLPFLPLLAAAGAGAPDTRQRDWPALALSAFLWTLVALAASQQAYWLGAVAPSIRTSPVAEVRDLTRKYGPSVAVGYSEPYRDANLRVVPVFSKSPYTLDAPALMDRQFAGLGMPQAVLGALDSCEPRVWLLPRGGEPFHLPSAYPPHASIFPAGLTNTFLRRYRRIDESPSFSVWSCID